MISENVVITPDFSWTDIESPMKVDFDFIEEEYGLPPMLVQDCLRPEHLPKFEKTSAGHFFLVRIFDPSSQTGAITSQRLTHKLAIFISGNRVITIHNHPILALQRFMELRHREGFPKDVRRLTHQLLRISVMSFEEILGRFQSNYEAFETDVLAGDSSLLTTKHVFEFRRKLYVIKGLLEQTLHSLSHSLNFWGEAATLQQDIKENIDQIYFRLEGLSHNFDQLFNLYLAMNDQRNNDTMKILTVFSSIMLPLTFIASFYGMNFNHIPGLQSTTGLVGAVVLMATTTFVTIWFFNKKNYFKSSM